MVLWMLSIAISVCLLAISAAIGAEVPLMASAHLVVAGLVSTVMALLAVSETRKLIENDRPQTVIAGTLMRFMGLIWAWAALVIFVTYGTGILAWSAWWAYFNGIIVIAGLCLFVSRVLIDAAAQKSDDANLLRITQYIAGLTLFVMVTSIAVFGVKRIYDLPVLEQSAWAADNVFLFGAFALAAVSSYLLKASVNQAR